MTSAAESPATNRDLIVNMNNKLSGMIKAEIGADADREMPDIPLIKWTIDRVDL